MTPAEVPAFPSDLWDAVLAHRHEGGRRFRDLAIANWRRSERHRSEVLDSVEGADPRVRSSIERAVEAEGSHRRATIPPLLAHVVDPDDAVAATAAIVMGVVCEYLHVGTLVHDDIIDEERQRRSSNDAAWVLLGTPMGVVLGDLLMALGQKAIGHVGLTSDRRSLLAASYADVACAVHESQAAEIVVRDAGELPTVAWCEGTTTAKTGALFGLAFASGLVCVGASDSDRAVAEQVGRQVGICFQILDDVADTTWDPAKGTYGDDLWEGKPSWVIAAAGPDVRRQGALRALLFRSRRDKGEREVAEIATLLDEAGAVPRALLELERQMDVVRSLLDGPRPAAIDEVASVFLGDFEAQATRLASRTARPPAA